MRLSPSPDLSSARALFLTVVAVSVAVWSILAFSHPNIMVRLGDTDDAMRLTLVRDLLGGRRWYDQLVRRLAPPQGVFMHWSRLLDGALASMDWLLGRVLPADKAEWATRYFWPLLWIPPVVAGALIAVRAMGSRSAVFVAAPLMISFFPLYRQFMPGRIDHHNVQITMAVIALAAALVRPTPPGGGQTRLGPSAGAAALCGIASGLGLAIGLEALPFHALIGASFAVRLIVDRRSAGSVRAYGLALAGATLTFYCAQTPPARWSMSFCDAIGLNLVLALVVAGAGLAGVASLAGHMGPRTRLGCLAVVGLGAVAAYLLPEPSCAAGPFAGLDPRVRPFWFDRIQEIQPLPKFFDGALGSALTAAAMSLMGTTSSAYLVMRSFRSGRTSLLPPPGRTSAFVLLSCMIVADVAGFNAWRMYDYVFWFGAISLAAALSYFAASVLKDRMVPTVALSAFVSPLLIAGAGAAAANAVAPANSQPEAGLPCSDIAGFRQLASLPEGVVLSEIDLGPHIIANTRDSAIAAPYHRMAASILAAHQAMDASPDTAEAKVRALGADYVVDCRGAYLGVGKGSLGWLLREGRSPPWLEPLSPSSAAIQVYRVRPRTKG